MTKGARAVVAVWLAAIVSAAGVAYAVREPSVGPMSTHVRAVKLSALVTYVGEPHAIAKRTTLSSPSLIAAAPPPRPRDISEMRCSDWRPLEQGGDRVQVCD